MVHSPHSHGQGFHQWRYFFDVALRFAQRAIHADAGDFQVNSFAGHGRHLQPYR